MWEQAWRRWRGRSTEVGALPQQCDEEGKGQGRLLQGRDDTIISDKHKLAEERSGKVSRVNYFKYVLGSKCTIARRGALH